MTAIVSWNIQAGRGVDGRVDLVRIARTVRALADADVICLQEVESRGSGVRRGRCGERARGPVRDDPGPVSGLRGGHRRGRRARGQRDSLDVPVRQHGVVPIADSECLPPSSSATGGARGAAHAASSHGSDGALVRWPPAGGDNPPGVPFPRSSPGSGRAPSRAAHRSRGAGTASRRGRRHRSLCAYRAASLGRVLRRLQHGERFGGIRCLVWPRSTAAPRTWWTHGRLCTPAGRTTRHAAFSIIASGQPVPIVGISSLSPRNFSLACGPCVSICGPTPPTTSQSSSCLRMVPVTQMSKPGITAGTAGGAGHPATSRPGWRTRSQPVSTTDE